MRSTEAMVFDRKSGGAEGPAVLSPAKQLPRVKALKAAELLDGEAHRRSLHSAAPDCPVELSGVGKLHAAFLTESRTRGRGECSLKGNPGTLRSG